MFVSLLLCLFSVLPNVKLKVNGAFWNFFLNLPATLNTIAFIQIIYVLSKCDQSLCMINLNGRKVKMTTLCCRASMYVIFYCCRGPRDNNVSTWSVMLLINANDSTITLPGAEISGTQNSISSLYSISQQKLSDLKPTHIFCIF